MAELHTVTAFTQFKRFERSLETERRNNLSAAGRGVPECLVDLSEFGRVIDGHGQISPLMIPANGAKWGYLWRELLV